MKYYFTTGVNFKHVLENGREWRNGNLVAVEAPTSADAMDFMKKKFNSEFRVPYYYANLRIGLKEQPDGVIAEYSTTDMTTTPQLTAQQLAFYIGQRCVAIYMPENEIASTFEITARVIALREDGVPDGAGVVWKPILRRFDTITEAEARVLYKLRYPLESWEGKSALNNWWLYQDEWYVKKSVFHTGTPAIWQYLLSLGIDLFGWIDAGLAIDKATIEQK